MALKTLSPEALGISVTQSELIELALTFKFQTIEYDMRAYARSVERLGEQRARRLFDSARLRIGVFPLPINWDVDDDAFRAELEAFLPLAQTAKDLGAICCTATIAPGSNSRPYHENFDFHQRRFSDISRFVAQFGMYVAVGFQPVKAQGEAFSSRFIQHFSELVKFVELVNQPALKLTVDPWSILVGGGSVDEIRSLSKESIGLVRLSDLPADCDDPKTLDESSKLLPGSGGPINVAEVLGILRETGFDGPVIPEADRRSYAGMKRDQVVEQAGRVIDEAM